MYTNLFFSVQDAYQLSGPRKCLWTLNSLDGYQFGVTSRGLWTLNSLDAYQIILYFSTFFAFFVFSKAPMKEIVKELKNIFFTSPPRKIRENLTKINLVHFGAPALQIGWQKCRKAYKCVFRILSLKTLVLWTLISFGPRRGGSGRLIRWTLIKFGGCWLGPGR